MVAAKVPRCFKQVGAASSKGLGEVVGAEDFAKCACCEGGSPVAESYSTCSSYLAKETPTLSIVISAFSTIYSACHASTAVCGAVSRTETADPVTTTKFIEPACHSVNNMYRSCIAETFDFTNLPFGRQASCYCCRTGRGHTSWTDELDNYARTCRDWASQAGSKSALAAARSFATFCSKFSDACSPTSTLSSTEATATPSSDATTGGSADQASQTASPASSRGSPAGFALVAVAMVAAM
ncbi:hypothetical protein OCS_05020 [Ophiocordyceps sinensis CO18]|uniref:Uncharacterized protein n=1 Tax=Ophiocordyceps sinensis (strain Co18 / CGMCC 3.14243) TaxID=911162 RepID=T5AC08_OPHSC|nr:hypothetical protein OCS_05020 [Ophiocordyceps sinensis CO18]